MAVSNLVKVSCFSQQKVNTSQCDHNTWNFTEFYDGCQLNLVFMIWWTESQRMPHDHNTSIFFYKRNWRVGGIFYVTFSRMSTWSLYINCLLETQLAGGWDFLSDAFSEFFQNDYLKATGGWVRFFIWRFLECPHDHYSSIFF